MITLENNTQFFPADTQLTNWFSGKAFLTPLISKDKNNDFSLGCVAFEPMARTNWHTHPKGQVLIVTDGIGFYQEKGKTAETIRKGDVINIPAETEHWHGASPSSKMVHLAITNYKGEEQVNWLQPVTDEEYAEAIKK
jgi:quercetin dioxygenase-like cupin family protein